ncbi:hypothetical protein amb0905 [Paramagnetospirillum magneticum AMB-1]|uniref:Uncharacterized protein n=1 Tax=Paramagnetospirillum magneticum (strain ATCC 700264 / AMB-1) TaxID=342108 RepID=Q2W8W6_PARM1|nr:hypothetical protein amb0905 [Paramagnetospirillum magneticum AMB-1]
MPIIPWLFQQLLESPNFQISVFHATDQFQNELTTFLRDSPADDYVEHYPDWVLPSLHPSPDSLHDVMKCYRSDDVHLPKPRIFQLAVLALHTPCIRGLFRPDPRVCATKPSPCQVGIGERRSQGIIPYVR